MGRSKRKSPAEELAEGIGRVLPWWACLALGVVCYFVLHAYAGRPLGPVTAPNQLPSAVTGSMLHALAMVGQYVLPLLFAAAAIVSIAMRRERQGRVVASTGPVTAGPAEQAQASARTARASPPSCPVCSKPMLLKTARRGANAGNAFWGCPDFSSGCRGTRPA
jgi:hypothetical protein